MDLPLSLAVVQHPVGFWMPPRASTFAGEVDAVFNFVMAVSIFFFVLIAVLMFYFAGAYRRREGGPPVSQVTHNTPLEMTWSIAPGILVVIMFWWGFKVYMDMKIAPSNAKEIKVLAQRWVWQFTYENNFATDELHVPVDTPVRLVMESADVLHSLFIPAFRVKMDVVPGRFTSLWFTATTPGEYPLLCTEYCGKDHSAMFAKVIVHGAGGYERFLIESDPFRKMTPEQFAAYMADPEKFIRENPEIKNLAIPADMGKKLYTRKGCSGCHTVDGSVNQGPSWLGVWGRTEETSAGPQTVDENYVRESILNPGAKVVVGYPNVMNSYQGRITEQEISALIAYMKTLKQP